MDNEREIEKVITEHLELKPMADLGCDGLYLSIPGVKALSQAILDYLKSEGWVRKEDV